MDTPEKNRISAVSFRNFEDSPFFQYINDLSPIEQVKAAPRADNILHSLAFTSPSSLFTSPQINSYRDSRFSIKRHRSLDLPSPVVLAEGVKKSPDVREAIKISGLREEKLTRRPALLENVSETKPFKEQISLAIELANSLKNQRDDGCDIEMVSCDEALIDTENGIGRVESIHQSDELCRRPSDPPEFDADLDGGLQTEEMEVEIRSRLSDIQNNKQQDPKIVDPRFHSSASVTQQFSLCYNNSGNVEDRGGSCSVQVSAGALDITLCNTSNVPAIDSTAKAEDKHETGPQSTRKQRSVRRRCLTFDVGVSYKKIPLRDSTNDLPLDFTSINKVHSPQKCLNSSKQDTDGFDPLPRKIGLHLNGLVNPSISTDGSKLSLKDARVLPHGPTAFPHNTEDEFSTPFSMKRDLVSCDNKINEKAPEISMEGECFDKDMPIENRNFSQILDGSSSCKRCKCRKSKCLKLYCDCFAAGLYCVDPCSCQNCFNKPIHEDIVMKTRQQIEARNPLAFASKVVSTSDSSVDFGDENSKTPASARHARGCNCKKSGCLKKYCECYMMEVGCSSNCRCIGCKNVFGHTNEQFHFPYGIESDSGTINEEAKDIGDHGDASSQNEEIERRNHMLIPSSVTLSSVASL